VLDPRLIPSPLTADSKPRQILIKEIRKPGFARFSRQSRLVSSLISSLAWLKVTGRLTPAEKGARIRTLLETLGGLWIKTGQIMALRRDIFGGEFCAELAKLQDQATGFSPQLARQILETELGCPIKQVFERFDDEPLAAASVGQVHRARLRGIGTEVAIKIQRPDIRGSFERDMKFIRRLAGTCNRLGILPHLRWDELVLELGQILTEEVDYRMEASSISRMKKSLRKHRIYVPKVFEEYSTQRVLVMEFVDGVFVSDYIYAFHNDRERLEAWMQQNRISARRIGRRLYFSLNRQVFEDGLFHSDLHPGNIVLLRESRLALIDFGAVGSLELTMRTRYGMMCRAIGAADYAKATDLLLDVMPAMPSYVDVPQLRSRTIFFFRAWERRALTRSVPYLEKSFSSIFTGLADIFAAQNIPVSWEFLRLNRTFGALDAPLMHLIPRASYPKMVRQYWLKADQRAIRQANRRASRIRMRRNLVATLGELPGEIGEVLMHGSELIRRAAMTFAQTTSKAAFFATVVFGTIVNIVRMAAAVLVMAFIAQRHPSWLTSGLNRLLQPVPRMSNLVWLLVALAILYFYREVAILKTRFSTRETVAGRDRGN
jgi:ubiquinone biosynthesis protein